MENEMCGTKPMRETEIKTQLNRLNGAIQNCIDNFGSILTKVDCVSRNQPPLPKEPLCDVDGLVPLATEIRDCSFQLEDLSSRMYDLSERIEL